MKILKFGCLGLIGFFIFIIAIGFLFGEDTLETSSNPENKESTVEKIIDVNQFSRVSEEKLIEIMGEPERVEDYEWSVPSTGESIVGQLYIYEQNKYEFIIFDNSVARLNIYSGKSMGYDDSTMKFNNEEELFLLFGIEPNSHLKKVADTNYALRYSPVSDTVADLWILEINESEFGMARITYNLNYF